MTHPESEKPKIVNQLNTINKWPYHPKEYLMRFAWEWIHRILIRPSFRKSFRWRKFWLKLFGADIAGRGNVKASTRILHPWLLKIGDFTSISEGVTIYNLAHVTIGDHSVISQDVYICGGTHDYTKPDMPLQRVPIVIGNGVWICAKAFIGPGVTIGDNSIVGACAVVTKDVPPGVIVAGNPAKVIKQRPNVESSK